MVNEDLFYELNITEDGYVIGRNNHDEADSVSIIGYTEESKHARLFVAAPKLLKALQDYMHAVNLMNKAMNDGCNVQGAVAALVGAEDMAYVAIAEALALGDTK